MSSPGPPPPGPAKLTRQLTRTGTEVDLDLEDDAPLLGTVSEEGVSPTAVLAPELTSSLSVSGAPPMFSFRCGSATDIGGGSENQDDSFILRTADGTLIMGVLDGHGRDLGKVASGLARVSFMNDLTNADTLAALRVDPKGTMTRVFKQANDAVRAGYVKHYESRGWTVTATEDGNLITSRHPLPSKSCVHGGSTATICVVFDGHTVIMGNVGDSTAILVGGALPIKRCTSAAGEGVEEVPAALMAPPPPASDPPVAFGPRTYMELSTDHSPESPHEFYRMRALRPCPRRAFFPELMFVYDSLTFSKFACRDIFAVDEAGEARTTGQGSYFKNVRNEWATLLTTPPHARYPDALAFTRSLGDFHLATWGVSCEPDVWTIDLADSKTEASTGRPLALCLCSDGVWDNWKYPDVSAFLCKDEYTELARTEEGAQSIANTFMAANLKEALSNFGAQADNMTAVLAYFHE